MTNATYRRLSVSAQSTWKKSVARSVAAWARRKTRQDPSCLDGGVMRMRTIPAMEVKSGDKLELKPGGYHAMLTDLKQPLKIGDRFPLVLGFEKAGSVEVSVWVEDMAAAAAPIHEHAHR